MSLVNDRDDDQVFIPEDIDGFVKALQDLGKKNAKTKEQLIEHKDLDKCCRTIAKLWKDNNFEGFPKNATHAKKAICKILVKTRKKFDASQVSEQFRKHANKDGEVLLLTNAEDAGFSMIIPLMMNFWSSNAAKKQTDRTPADAIRLAGIMCLQENRKAMIQLLSKKKKDRAMNDQASNIDLAVFEKMLPTFKDPDFKVDRPAIMDAKDVDPDNKIDPNSDHNWEDRDAAWLMETWAICLRKPHRATLFKWFKNTGGGPRTDDVFPNHTVEGKTWLVWVHIIDKKSFMLLAGEQERRFQKCSTLQHHCGPQNGCPVRSKVMFWGQMHW